MSDWIKMRAALLTDPKVAAIARALRTTPEFSAWLVPAGGTTSQAALLCVTTALLLRVWSTAREHGQFAGNDLHLPYSTTSDIDDLAGVPGIGEAMKGVDWIEERQGARGIFLPNFKKFNVPMTRAEVQAAYRDRLVTKSLLPEGHDAVTKKSPSRRRSLTTSLRSVEGPKRQVATRLPGGEEWTLPTEWRQWASKERPKWTDASITFVAEQFRDYWLGATKGTKVDWFATWRMWVRKESAIAAGQRPSNGAVHGWMMTPEGVIAKGEELGIAPRMGETSHAYRERLRKAVDEGAAG